MSDRLPTAILVAALLRRVNDSGGFGAVLAKGDAHGGAILVITLDRGGSPRMLERGLGSSGSTALIESTPADDAPETIRSYWQRRREYDPDLWVIEVDIAGAERFAAEILLGN